MNYLLSLDSIYLYDSIHNVKVEILGRGTLPGEILSHGDRNGNFNFESPSTGQRFMGQVKGVSFIRDYVAPDSRFSVTIQFKDYLRRGRPTELSFDGKCFRN